MFYFGSSKWKCCFLDRCLLSAPEVSGLFCFFPFSVNILIQAKLNARIRDTFVSRKPSSDGVLQRRGGANVNSSRTFPCQTWPVVE